MADTQKGMHPVIRTKAHRRSRGFSIIELLIAIIIIGILVTVLIPVISNRTEQARVAKAQQDLSNLAEAMERVAIDSTYYVRLFALNDTLNGDGIPFNRGLNNDIADGLGDYTITNPFYENVDDGLFIDVESGQLAGVETVSVFNRMLRSESVFNGGGGISWQGPYINFRVDNNYADGSDVTPDGIPDDPWGNNYLLFTEAGLVLEPDGTIEDSVAYNATVNRFVNGGTYDCERFDRGTILSTGPNGLPGDGTITGADGEFGLDDDLFIQFGR